jgi:putative component of membrane protein insertase Oxa1/YidC/SpoIIIJ protein YidD
MPPRCIDEPGLAARWALRAIRAYQRHLSPRKGFSCALRAASGRPSCSVYGYRVIARCGLRKGWRLLRRRLDACGQQHRSGAGPLSYQQGSCDPGCGDLSCDVGDVVSGACDLLGNFGSCGSCDPGAWSRSDKKRKSKDANFEALRARVEARRKRAEEG